MKDCSGILQDYVPLTFVSVERVLTNDPDSGKEISVLSGYHFYWQGQNDDELYAGDTTVAIGPHEAVERQTQALLLQQLAGEPLRLPDVSSCDSNGMLITADLAEKLQFHAGLGVTCSDTSLTDALRQVRTGYSLLTFHKALTPARFEYRFAEVPVAQRLLVNLRMNSGKTVFFIHKALQQAWLAADVTGFSRDIDEQYLALAYLTKQKFLFEMYQDKYYRSLQAYQANE